MNAFTNFFKEPAPSTDKITDPELIKKLYRSQRIKMFIGMYVGYMLFYFTRKNISPVLHIFSKEMNISMMELGVLGTTFYITYGVGKFLSGMLADRSNIRVFMAVGLFMASLVNIFFGFWDTLWILTILWGLNGAFQSMGFPPVAKGLVHWYAPNHRATMWTLWSSSHTAGTFCIGLLAAVLLKYFGWRSAFYVPGVMGIITSLILFKTLRDRPVTMGLPAVEDYSGQHMPVKTESGLTQWQTLKKYVFSNPFLWMLCISYIFVYLIRFGTLDWATKFMFDVRGIDKVRVAIMWSIMPLFGMPGGIVAGWIADRYFDGRCTPINIIYLILLAGSIYGFYELASMDNFYLTCFFLAAIGFLVDGPQNLVGGVQVSRITVPEAVSAACGFAGMFGYVGAALSGVGLAYVTEHWGWAGMYGVCIASCFIAAGLIATTWKREK